jgi:hypothetical protein
MLKLLTRARTEILNREHYAMLYAKWDSAKRTILDVQYLNRCRIKHPFVHVCLPNHLLIASHLEERRAVSSTLMDEPVTDYAFLEKAL